MKYRTVAEADRKLSSDMLLFGWDKLSPTSTDWVGGVFVIASSAEEAAEKFDAFFQLHATAWKFDEPELIKPGDWGLDFEAMEIRGHLAKLEEGEVVAGFGL